MIFRQSRAAGVAASVPTILRASDEKRLINMCSAFRPWAETSLGLKSHAARTR